MNLNEPQNPQLNIGAVSGRTDVWNSMVKLMNQHPDAEVRRKAEILLGQYNTAGCIRIKGELEFMLQEYGY